MASFKVVIGTKQGKCVQKEIQDPEAKALLGKKIGDSISGDQLGLAGYEFQVTGGSDYCGFPMRKDVEGYARKRILAVSGIGLKKTGKGKRVRKTVCGNTIHPKISQVNLKVLKEGKSPLVAAEGAEKPAEASAKEKKPAEAPKKEAPKAEKPAEKKEEKPAEKKEESKPAEKKEAPAEKKE